VKLINDTLKSNGKWSMKRVSGFASFWLAVFYEFTGLVFSYETKQYVFEALLAWAGVVILGSIADKKFKNKNAPEHDNP
jgi:hypothetical protein